MLLLDRVFPTGGRRTARAFSLLELLVVIAIIGLLVGFLAPALSSARRNARAVVCKTNLKSLMMAVLMYSDNNSDLIVPSYNTRGVSASIANPLDGWGPILDKGHYLVGNRELHNNPFACPDTVDIAGMAETQTGRDPNKPKGYMDWPTVITLSQNFAITIPRSGFERIIRVGYWINADNPLGRPQSFQQGIHFTGSVGYGPNLQGQVMKPNLLADIVKPSRLIALADGLYAGQQESTRLGDRNSRIGYRHPGGVGGCNLGFADGHVGATTGDRFPRKFADGLDIDEIRRENLGPGPTVYSDPHRFLSDPG